MVLLLIFRVKPIPHKPVIHIHIPNGGKTHRSGGSPCFHAPDLCRFFLLPAVVVFAQFRWQIKRCGSDSRVGRVALIVPRLLRFSIEVLSALLNTTASKRTARMNGNGCRYVGNGWAASAAKGTASTTTKRYTIETLAQTTTLNCVISVEGFYVN